MIRCTRLDTNSFRPTATIAIVTFVVLVLELTSTRLYAYVGSSHATSTALSIALLGLGVGAYLRVRSPSWAQPQRATPMLSLALFCLAAASIAGAPLGVLVALSLVPFALAGMLVSDAYAARGRRAARSTYAMDVFAAASGCLVAPRVLGPLSPTEIMLALGLVCCGLALMLVARRVRVVAPIAAIAVAHVVLLAGGRAGYLPDGPLEVLLGFDARSEKAIVESGTSSRDVVDSAWSPLGRLDVKRVPGDTDRLGVFTDGMSPTYLVRETRAREASFEHTWGLLMSLPYRALEPRRVLVLGAGVGVSVWLAKKYGASRIDAVEVNPAIPGLLARWKHFGGDVYQQVGVRLFIDDARRYLADTSERYDLIELALALTGNVHAQPSGMESHLYTVEAVQLYLDRLTPTGVLVLIHSDSGNAYRQLLTVLEALAARGVSRERALEGIVVLHDPRRGTAYKYMLVVGTSPMPLEVVEGLDVAPAELLWGPGDPPERSTQLLDRKRLGATAADDFSPVYDERPYFFQNTKGLLATALAEEGRLGVGASALLLVFLLIVQRGRSEDRSFGRPAVAACVLGAAFLGVELALIQRFTLAAGGTLYSLSFVLFGLLAWSGAGALLLGNVWRRLDHGVTWACVVAALAVATTALVVRDLVWIESISSDPTRMLLIAVLLAPVGLAIGCPFPVLLVRHGEPTDRIASLWAINGAASVAGGIMTVLALRVAGSTQALLLAAGLYLLAAAIARFGAE